MKQAAFLILIFSAVSFAQTGYYHFYNYKKIDANNISGSFTNYGNLYEYDTAEWNLLTPYPGIVFDVGPWIVGKLNGIPTASVNEWFSLYSPGPIINGQPGILAQPGDSLTFRIYKISKGDDNSNPDYAAWPDTLGAPVNQNGDPLVYGDQTLWSVYNGIDTTLSSRNINGNYWPPLPVEIRQTVFAHSGNYNDVENIFSNVLFLEWTIINKGDQQIDSAYFGFWSDIDFDLAIRNIPAVDSAAQIAYCWSDTSFILNSVPALGFQLLYGPVTASAGDTAIFKGRSLPGYKNTGMTSFHGIGDDSIIDLLNGPIWSVTGAWNVARGFDINGSVIINPVTNEPTKFPYSGDPVTQQGWYPFPLNRIGGGAGVVFFSGPFNLAPRDTQWAMVALVPGLGGSPLSSIVNMRQKAEILSLLPYDSLAWGNMVYGITEVKDNLDDNIPNRFALYQNYPNPFNPVTIIKYSVPVYKTISKVTLKVYDVLGSEVAALVNDEKPAGEYNVTFNASKLSSGIYFYQLKTGAFIQTKKMVLLK